MSSDLKQLQALVHGRVQGVGFRHFVWSQARALNLQGWVRNEADGTVSITAEGTEAALQRLLRELRTGPPGAEVTHVDANWTAATGGFRGFVVRR